MPTRTFNGRIWRYDNGNLSNLLARIETLENDGFAYIGNADLAVIGRKPVLTPDPGPIPPDPNPIPPDPPMLVWSNGWDNIALPLGSSIQTLLDGGPPSAWNDFGPSWHNPYLIAEVVNRSGPRMLQVNFLKGAGGNGPDFRIVKLLGQAYPNIYIAWDQEWSPNWVWASSDHKLAIFGASDSDQAVYYNVRGNGNGPVGRPVIYVTRLDTMFSDSSVEIRGGVRYRFQIHIQNGQPVQAKVDEKLLTLTPEAGSGTSPIAANNGTGMVKLDTTYNNYAYPESVNGALPARTWYDRVQVSTQGWIG